MKPKADRTPHPLPSWVVHAFTAAAKHYQAGLHEEARQLLVATLERKPDHADSMYLLAAIAGQSGDADLAEGLLRQAIAIDARKTPYWVLLGNVLQQRGHLEESTVCYRSALALDGTCVDAWYNWGNTLERQGDNRQATEFFERTVALEPKHVQGRNNLGNQYRQAGRLKEAATQLEEAGRLDPRSMPVVLNRGNVWMAEGRHEEALACFDRAIGMMPAVSVLHNNRGNTLREIRRITEALEAYDKAIELEPERAEFWVNRGVALQTQGRMGEALDSYRRALTLSPEIPAAHGAALFTLHYDPDTSAEDLLEAHREWGRRHTVGLGRGDRAFPNAPDGEKRLRIGYVSPDFRQHPVSFFVLPVLAAHDEARVESFCYFSALKKDAWTERIAAESDAWREVSAMSDRELAEQVERDGIDVLVDLTGHTSGNRLLAFARKPAPIQVSWLGYFNTTGMEAMDYLAVDDVVCPAGEDALFVEQPLRLGGCYIAYEGPPYAPPVASLPESGPITFGCFNTLSKVTPEVIAVWARILKEEPASRLVLKNAVLDDPLSRQLCLGAFAQHGIAETRVELHGSSTHEALLSHYAGIDVALDPFPYNGGTTTCEALWMGVPVVTLAGERFVSRVGETILRHAGCENWVARSLDEYVAKALELGRSRGLLAEWRASLREKVRSSVLGDTKTFTRRWEDALRVAWRKWCDHRI